VPKYSKSNVLSNINCRPPLTKFNYFLSIKWFRGTDEIFSYIATLSDSGVSTIAKSVPGIFIQASELIFSYIATLSISGVSTIAKSVPGISSRQVN